MTPAHLICCAKAPVAGTVKTRLAASIGDTKALAIYHRLLHLSGTCLHHWHSEKTLAYSGDPHLLNDFFHPDIPRREQCSGGLGQRLLHAATPTLTNGGTVILIGCDCPRITCDSINSINTLLHHENTNVAFGPSDDGGYWCIAINSLSAAHICLASTLPWSQENLLSETKKQLTANHIPHSSGITLNDIDTLNDLQAAIAEGF